MKKKELYQVVTKPLEKTGRVIVINSSYKLTWKKKLKKKDVRQNI